MSSVKLKNLSPTDFENFIFDLMVLKGLRNVRWRTPGADGGRDVEADEVHTDIANTQVVHKWYIECKRYKSSVDWPTIFSKISYAESHGANYLLMCTSAKFTPVAISEVEKWNLRRGSVQVRLWPGHEIEHQIKPFFDLRAKYGIEPAPTPQGDKLAKLSLAVSKSIETYYGKLTFADVPIDPMIVGAQAVAMLIRQRLEDFEHYGSAHTSLIDIRTITAYPITSKTECRMDQYAYEALRAYHYALSREEVGIKIIDDRSCLLSLSPHGYEVFCRYNDVFAAILFWGDIEWNIEAQKLTLLQRLS
jgi:hypothetical protein